MRTARRSRSLQALCLTLCALPLLGVTWPKRRAGGGGSSVSVVSWAMNADSGADSTHNCTAPATVNSGNELVCVCHDRDTDRTGTISLSGWTQRADYFPGDLHVWAFSKDSVDGSEDSTTYGFTQTGGATGKAICAALALDGAAGTYEEAEGGNGTAATSATVTAISSPGSGTIAVRFCALNGSVTAPETCDSGCSTASNHVESSSGQKVEGVAGYESISGSDSGGAMSWGSSADYSCISVEVE